MICPNCGFRFGSEHEIFIGGKNKCPICTLERRVEELSQRMTGLEMKRIESMTIQLAPSPEPKHYSGFTWEEWELMFRDGPLLCGTGDFESACWIDSIDKDAKYIFRSGLGVGSSGFTKVTLLEQPNWRPYMADGCPVPERVRVEVCYLDESLFKENDVASRFLWISNGHYSDIRAYRILGT